MRLGSGWKCLVPDPHSSDGCTPASRVARGLARISSGPFVESGWCPMHSVSRPANYQARLTETGLAVDDSIVLCGEYRSSKDWLGLKSKALKENLLGRGSRSRTAKLLGAVERRIVNAAPPLDRPVPIARFLAAESRVTSAAKAQLLLVLALNDDIALRDAYRELVIPAVTGIASKMLPRDEIHRFLRTAAETRPEVARWSVQTKERWAQGFRLVLREAGFVAPADKSASPEIRPPVVRDEVTAFLAHAIADAGVSGWPILRHATIMNLLFTEGDALRAARSQRSWVVVVRPERPYHRVSSQPRIAGGLARPWPGNLNHGDVSSIQPCRSQRVSATTGVTALCSIRTSRPTRKRLWSQFSMPAQVSRTGRSRPRSFPGRLCGSIPQKPGFPAALARRARRIHSPGA